MGVNVDFAPVADVTSGPGNTVIGTRSFGSDPDRVAELTADVAVALDTPYALADSAAPVKIAAYSSAPPSLQAVAQLIAGAIPVPGRLPVAVAGLPPTACP